MTSASTSTAGSTSSAFGRASGLAAALHAAAGFLVLSTGVLAARPERGW